ncbi:MAG: tyrosine-type recombinase/integrase [Planctomycetia bacterium]|nr:tyrosine-type recombinase/integrase [Planctomycetia bacterium]
MASITKVKRKNGTAFRIEFFDGKRQFIRLSTHYNERTAQAVKNVVERILSIRENGLLIDKKTVSLITSLSEEIREKLSEVGLLEERQKMPCLGELWERYLEANKDKKASTLVTYRTAKVRFFTLFDPNETPDKITLERAQQWRAGLVKILAPATVASTVTRVRTVFKWAIETGLSEDNPFLKVEKGSFVNKDNERFITPNEYERLLTACPGAEWRALLALCRVGGLRTPSETMALKWADIDFETGRFWVTSPKTERHEGKAGRLVPLFPKLREELERLAKERKPGDIYVITYNRGDNQTLRFPFRKIISRAGLERWPRLFHNLRGSRSNELYREYPATVAAYWLGHSPRTAISHYLHPLESDYQQAIKDSGGENGGKGSEKERN